MNESINNSPEPIPGFILGTENQNPPGHGASPENNSAGNGATPSQQAAGGSAATQRRGRGRPRKAEGASQIPLGQMGGGSIPSFVEDAQPGLAAQIPSAPDFIFDQAKAEKGAAFVIKCLEASVSEIRIWRITRRTKDEAFANFIVEKLGPEDEAKDGMHMGLVGLAEELKVDLSKMPLAMFACGFLLWQVQDSRKIRQAVAEYQKLVAVQQRQ